MTELLVGLGERGLDLTRPILAVRAGSTARRRAVLDVVDPPVRARGQLHQIRHGTDKLPPKLRPTVATKMRAADHADAALAAQAPLEARARELDTTHPGAAASLPAGREDTLTVGRLELPPTLARTFRSTHPIASMLSIARDHARNLKRWRDGSRARRWCAAGMVEAQQQFRHVNGHLHLATRRAALEREVAKTVGPVGHDEKVSAAC